MYGVWHFSFTVADIERSVIFYRDDGAALRAPGT